MDVGGFPDELLWRWIFGIGALLSAWGLVLRITTIQDAEKFKESKAGAARRRLRRLSCSLKKVKRDIDPYSEEVIALLETHTISIALNTLQQHLRPIETEEREHQETTISLLLPYWRPLLGTAGCWCLYDIVEYGLKQNDAAIFNSASEAEYRQSVLDVFFTRLLVSLGSNAT